MPPTLGQNIIFRYEINSINEILPKNKVFLITSIRINITYKYNNISIIKMYKIPNRGSDKKN